MSNYTEGPWHYDRTNDAIYNKFCLYICDAPTNNKHDVELIAAAPELLEALEEALPMLHTGDELPMSYYKDKSGALGKALRAIAKAKGEV